jgi:hypothetical protein
MQLTPNAAVVTSVPVPLTSVLDLLIVSVPLWLTVVVVNVQPVKSTVVIGPLAWVWLLVVISPATVLPVHVSLRILPPGALSPPGTY